MACIKHISCFIWGALHGDYRGIWVVPLLRINTFYSGFSPVHEAGCSFQNNLLCVWITYSHLWLCNRELGSCINPDKLFYFVAFKTKVTAPNLAILTINFSKGSSESWWYWSTKWDSSFTLNPLVRDLQDGRGVRHGDHLPPHKYIKNTSTYGTTPTEHILNAGRRPQTSQKARKSPCTWVGQKKKKKQRQKNRDGTCTSGRELWRRKSFHTLGSPFTSGEGCFGATKESAATGVQRTKQRDSHTKYRYQPALTSLRGLSAHPPGQVAAGRWGSGFGGQTPGRGVGLATWRQPEGSYCATASQKGVWAKVWTCQRGKRPFVSRCARRGDSCPACPFLRRQSTA